MTAARPAYVLAGDAGGTKTNLGIFALRNARPVSVALRSFVSRDYTSLEDLLDAFLRHHALPVRAVCVGVPGPIINGVAHVVNLPWTPSERTLRGRFPNAPVRLVNDLVATAAGVLALRPKDRHVLNRGRADRDGAIAVLAPGTGLGAALAVRSDARIAPVPSEAGHMDFSPNTDEEADLWRYLHHRFGHVSAERVLSGPGQVNVYNWLRDSGRYGEPARLKAIVEAGSPARTITELGLQGKSPICVASLRHFVRIMGSVAGNLALAGMATGGVYLAGGIPPKIRAALRTHGFMEAFVSKGRLRSFMRRIPVTVVLDDKTALLGAAMLARELTERICPAPKNRRISNKE